MSATNAVSTRELVIIGAGGFGAVAASLAEEIKAAAIEHDCAAPWDLIGYADTTALVPHLRFSLSAGPASEDKLGRLAHFHCDYPVLIW